VVGCGGARGRLGSTKDETRMLRPEGKALESTIWGKETMKGCGSGGPPHRQAQWRSRDCVDTRLIPLF
jgi:hypothetical protein